ncbi:ubiquitin carboxyl-terminal hydrolase 40-like isoform X2 [Mercenaria mercenaria]|uniref:ubiquitin carboxyl-terminal hydrolase 40-like isoform X2 n=1 Tax=Mercenaria mercenaria TaxID=6596 RepID=UPI00234EA8D3|nr:ubiquitin carboxyl-terminal hydrolase 40-like isoform X2 [Mercenaria mercenaria]
MAGLLGNLFEEEGSASGEITTRSHKSGIPAPPRPRGQCQLSGLDNQGATCYLNSLLQTLLLTPEFRDGLFCLREDELGRLCDADNPRAKVRVIPIHLQRLFARLLLKNCQSVSTKDLTHSFGWINDEQFYQNDVQELNRILFSAIESSLVGTSGCNLIKQLYHGKIVNQIRCTQCGKVSEREEDFLDIPVAVAGLNSLEESLHVAYREVEMLDGKNQYRCGGCKKLVDAEKGAKLRSLPSILTISLLRFSFDFGKMERFKETGKFSFPHTVNMQPYCENAADGKDLEYELFSVVIHIGGAGGGHYHAYVRDIDGLGQWVTPEEEEIIVPTDPFTGTVDFIECDSPIDLVQVILSREKNKGMSVDKLGQEILKQTGLSWNKRFKGKYGAITKFLTKYNDKFIFDPVHKHVSLQTYGPNSETQNSPAKTQPVPSTSECTCDKNKNKASDENREPDKQQNQSSDKSCDKTCDKCARNSGSDRNDQGDSRNVKKRNGLSEKPNPGKAWFDFNDSHVHPIYEKAIEKQFSGRESAYMLFYRKKSLVRPNKAYECKTYCMSENLITEMMTENSLLDEERKQYDIEMNKLTLQIHFSRCYQYREGALKPRDGMLSWQELIIDQRNTTTQLYEAVMELGMEYLPCDQFRIAKFKELPAGGHIYDSIQESEDLLVKHFDVQDGSKLFVWDGESLNGMLVPTGIDQEPVYITVIYGDGLQFSRGYSKALTLHNIKTAICDIIRIQVKNLRLKRIYGKDSEVKMVPLTNKEENSCLAELQIKDGDQLLAEDTAEKGSGISEESVSSTIYSCKFVVQVENRCVELSKGTLEHPTTKVEVDRTITVSELKGIVMTKLHLETIPDGGRLRIDHDTLGLRQPLHEEQSIFDAGITQGSRLVLEPGPSPQSDEITLSFTCELSMSGPDYSEVIVKRNSTVGSCLQCILERAKITEGDWHLRKTNWCGEAAELLDDPDSSLEYSLVNDGDVLLLERGRLPPKGFIRIPVWLHSTPESVKAGNQQNGSILSWVSNFFGQFVSDTQSSRTSEVSSEPHPVNIGEIEISRESTLFDLKEQVLTLVGDLPIPSVDFMRLRLKEQKRLTTVLRDNNQTLKRLKLTSNSVLALQILPEEEELRNDQIVLDICQRIPDTSNYSPSVELVWDTSGGATIHSLKQAIANVLFIETEHMCMAKHFPQKYEWMVIEKNDKQGNQKGKKKKGQAKNNIKLAPFHIRDGDTIGVKDMRYDPNNLDKFMTEEDEIGKLQLLQEIEEKRKMREERKKYENDFGPVQKQRRPEVGITIKVGDFS